MITDNRMPKMSGLDLIKKQAAYGCKGEVQNKLVLTSVNSKKESQMAKGIGCKILKKPFKLAEIQHWIAECEKGIDPNRKLADLNLATL